GDTIDRARGPGPRSAARGLRPAAKGHAGLGSYRPYPGYRADNDLLGWQSMKASTPPGATSEYGAEHDRPGAGRVVVLGSVNMDLVVPAPHVPGPGETVIAGPARYLPGGKGANQAVTAARLGAEVGFIGRTGDDDFGRTLRRALQDAG